MQQHRIAFPIPYGKVWRQKQPKKVNITVIGENVCFAHRILKERTLSQSFLT